MDNSQSTTIARLPKSPFSVYWLVSLAVLALIFFVTGGGLIGGGNSNCYPVAFGYYNPPRNCSTYNAGLACIGIGCFVKVVFWIVFISYIIRRRRAARSAIIAASSPHANGAVAETGNGGNKLHYNMATAPLPSQIPQNQTIVQTQPVGQWLVFDPTTNTYTPIPPSAVYIPQSATKQYTPMPTTSPAMIVDPINNPKPTSPPRRKPIPNPSTQEPQDDGDSAVPAYFVDQNTQEGAKRYCGYCGGLVKTPYCPRCGAANSSD